VNDVGSLDWEACERCVHYRPNRGGCTPLDEQDEDILVIDLLNELVTCTEFSPVAAQSSEAPQHSRGEGHDE
jgi:hypothetical protein